MAANSVLDVQSWGDPQEHLSSNNACRGPCRSGAIWGARHSLASVCSRGPGHQWGGSSAHSTSGCILAGAGRKVCLRGASSEGRIRHLWGRCLVPGGSFAASPGGVWRAFSDQALQGRGHDAGWSMLGVLRPEQQRVKGVGGLLQGRWHLRQGLQLSRRVGQGMWAPACASLPPLTEPSSWPP